MLKHLKTHNQIKFAILKRQRQQIAYTEIIARADMLRNLQRRNFPIHSDRVRILGQDIAHAEALTTTGIEHTPHRQIMEHCGGGDVKLPDQSALKRVSTGMFPIITAGLNSCGLPM
jgi:hypothetical protein